MSVRDIEMSVSHQADGRWLVLYVKSGTVEIQGMESKEQAIEYITTKPSGEFGRFVYVAVESKEQDQSVEHVFETLKDAIWERREEDTEWVLADHQTVIEWMLGKLTPEQRQESIKFLEGYYAKEDSDE